MKRNKLIPGGQLALKESNQYPHGAVEGYASTWNVDLSGERFVKGAFLKSINERLRKIKLIDSHNMRGPASQSTIGILEEAAEDNHGLYIVASFASTTAAQEMRKLVADKIISDFSVGGYVIQEEYDDRDKCLCIKECALREVSLVNEPCNPEAVVMGVKSLNDRVNLFPVATADTPFDPQGAFQRFTKWCSTRKGFLPSGFLYVDGDVDLRYQIVDVINDTPMIIPSAVSAIAKSIATGNDLPLSRKDMVKALEPFVSRANVVVEDTTIDQLSLKSFHDSVKIFAELAAIRSLIK